MKDDKITEKDRQMARRCMSRPVCNRARKRQKGVAYWLVKNVEDALCPFCKAYRKVYVQKAYEPVVN